MNLLNPIIFGGILVSFCICTAACKPAKFELLKREKPTSATPEAAPEPQSFFEMEGPDNGETGEILTYRGKSCDPITSIQWNVTEPQLVTGTGETFEISFNAQGIYIIQGKCQDTVLSINVTITNPTDEKPPHSGQNQSQSQNQ